MNYAHILRLLLATLALVIAGVGCAVPAADEPIEVGSYTEVGSSTEALRIRQNTGSSTNQCDACGCVWRHEGYDNGCKIYRCVCTSQADAECVIDNGGPGRPAQAASADTYEDDVDIDSPWQPPVRSETSYLYRGI